MAQTPFYKVFVVKNNRDISDLISKISYEDATDIDNVFTIYFEKPDTSLIDDPDLQEGSVLSFYFGFLSGKSSPRYMAKISDIIPSYGNIISLTIRATDLGIDMKKRKSKKIWSNMRASDIVTSIAQANGLRAVVDKTDIVHKSIPQGGKTDYDFVKYLVSIEKDGSWRFYLRGDEIHFTRVKLEQQSRVTMKYNDADGGVISFRPYSLETLKQASSRDTVVTSVDPFTNKAIQTVVNNETAVDDVKTGDYVYSYNFDAQQVNRGINPFGKQTGLKDKISEAIRPSAIQANQVDPSKAGDHVYSPASNIDEIINHGNKKKKKAAMFDYQGVLEIEGDPDYAADIIVSMAGVAKKDSGNWYVSRINHVIDSENGYKVRMTLNKNAGKKPIDKAEKKQTNVNKTVGPDAKQNLPVKTELKPHYYDENSKEIFK